MSTSISIKELKELDPSSYQIVDIRDAVEISHSAIFTRTLYPEVTGSICLVP